MLAIAGASGDSTHHFSLCDKRVVNVFILPLSLQEPNDVLENRLADKSCQRSSFRGNTRNAPIACRYATLR
jgi:hypothetical protein